MNDLKLKLNASIMTNDILNTVFPSVINTNYPIRPVGRPRLSQDEIAKRELERQPKRPVRRPRKNAQ